MSWLHPLTEDDLTTCDCGHSDFEEEVSTLGDKTFCVNCAREWPSIEVQEAHWTNKSDLGLRNTDHVRVSQPNETGNVNEERK